MSQSMLVLVLFGAEAFSATANKGEVASCSGGEAEASNTIITQGDDDKDEMWDQLEEKMDRMGLDVSYSDEEKALEMLMVNQELKAALESGKVWDLKMATGSAEWGLHTASSYAGYASAKEARDAARAKVIAMLKDAVAAKDVELLKTAVKTAEDASMRVETEHYSVAMELLSELKGETPYTCRSCLLHVGWALEGGDYTVSDETKEECLSPDDDKKMKGMRNAIAKVASDPIKGGCASGCEKRIPDADIIKF